MDNTKIDQLIKKLEMVEYEWICLLPRLNPTFRRNAEACRDATREVIDALKLERNIATACGHTEYRDGHCAELSCSNYIGKR